MNAVRQQAYRHKTGVEQDKNKGEPDPIQPPIPLLARVLLVTCCSQEGSLLLVRDIAERLFIAEETVKVHIRHIMEKLGARDRTEAVAIGVRRGFIQL